MTKPFSMLTAILLLALAVLHGLWLWLGWNVTLNGLSLPVWVPVAGLVLTLLAGLGLVVEATRGGGPAVSEAADQRGATRDVSRRPGVKFTVHQGKRYKAVISLGFFEQMASNDMIAEKLQEVGFADVVVSGSGGTREAIARWTGADTSAEMPPQLASAVEMPDPAPAPKPVFAQASVAPAAAAVVTPVAAPQAPAADKPTGGQA